MGLAFSKPHVEQFSYLNTGKVKNMCTRKERRGTRRDLFLSTVAATVVIGRYRINPVTVAMVVVSGEVRLEE